MNTTLRRTPVRTVVLTVLLAVTGTALTACGNSVDARIVGRAGIGVDDEGRPVAVVRVCDGEVDTIELLGDRTGLDDDEPNPVLGTWRADRARTGTVELTLDGHQDGWTGPEAPELEDGRTYVLNASDSGADAEASQVSFTPAQLRDLDADQVLVADGSVEDRSTLDRCDDE
ncbi:hypothetical protein CFH99_13270 [Nocardioides aromaticivorans]|uniref:Lipoprotein n=1 Tax=Nocardioides aromaticivorans TaxID=200618 RepID=A0ABX7PL93_9ACTN|nr:hypothetical protein [Nocardioides aromaticivorans]QSR26596.1 hypothetical protein CFH99_13270 [Nocardioides aromaticivorans]